MKQVIINRFSDDGKQTPGSLSFVQDNGHVFLCKTLEIPWMNNHSDTSCIPAGTYNCRFTKSARFTTHAAHDMFTYEVTNIPGRSAIRIHSANFFSDLLDCIALEGALQDINGDGEQDVINSRNTIHAFENELCQQEFTLMIHAKLIA